MFCSPPSRPATRDSFSDILIWTLHVCVCVCLFVCACVRLYVCVHFIAIGKVNINMGERQWSYLDCCTAVVAFATAVGCRGAVALVTSANRDYITEYTIWHYITIIDYIIIK